MFKHVAMAIALMMMAHMVHAQVVYAKTEEFTLLKKRTLLVEQLELDEEKVEGWKRKRDKAKGSKPKVEQRYSEMIDEYTAFVNTYNAGMRAAVEAIWDFNTEVEYKTVSEIRELRKKKSTNYTVLWYSESRYNSSPTGMDAAAYFPNLAIPTLNYSRIEEGIRKVDYSFFMPYTGQREVNRIRTSDLVLCLTLMRTHILDMEKTQKRLNFKKFMVAKAKENCSSLKGKTIGVNPEQMGKKTTIKELDAAFTAGKVVKMTDDEISERIMSGKSAIVGFCIPYGIVAGSAGPLSASRIEFARGFIDLKTGIIYTCTGTTIGDLNDPIFRAGEFKAFNKC